MTNAQALLDCYQCGAPIPWQIAPHQMTVCPGCKETTELYLFPAAETKTSAAGRSTQSFSEDEAVCFNHESRKATVICEGCGKFLCALCDVEWEYRHLCSQCITREQAQNDNPEAKRLYYRHDVLALCFLAMTILMWFLSFVFYPVALILIVMGFRKPMSAMPRRRWLLYLTFLVALLFPFSLIGLFLVLLEF